MPALKNSIARIRRAFDSFHDGEEDGEFFVGYVER
jgi:hypothetical protein